MEFFSPTFRALIKKLHFTKYYSFDPRCSKLIFKTGNEIISPTSGLLIKICAIQIILGSINKMIIFKCLVQRENTWKLYSNIEQPL